MSHFSKTLDPASLRALDALQGKLSPSEFWELRRRLAYRERWASRAVPNFTEGMASNWWREPLDSQVIFGWWQDLLSKRGESGSPDLIQSYLHIPFCRSKCSFCCYGSVARTDQDEIEKYLQAVEFEAQTIAQALGPIRVQSATVGGGTPSQLSVSQLRRAFDAVFGPVFEVEPGAFFSVEYNPDSTTEEKVALLTEYGVNRLSFGVQSFHQPTLHAVARGYQREEMVRHAVELGKKYGLMVSVDLLTPLVLETRETFELGVRKVIDMAPGQLVLYGYRPVERTGIVIEQGELDYKWAADCFRTLTLEAGYELVMETDWSMLVQRPEEAREWVHYVQHRAEPSSLIGVGPFAESHVFGRGSYEGVPGPDRIVRYEGGAWEVDTMRSNTISRHMVEATGLSIGDWRLAFGDDPEDYHPEGWAFLRELGVVQRNEEWIEFTEPVHEVRRAHSWLFIDPTRQVLLRRKMVEAQVKHAFENALKARSGQGPDWEFLQSLGDASGAVKLDGLSHDWRLVGEGDFRSFLYGEFSAADSGKKAQVPAVLGVLEGIAQLAGASWPAGVVQELARLMVDDGLVATLRMTRADQGFSLEVLVDVAWLLPASQTLLLGELAALTEAQSRPLKEIRFLFEKGEFRQQVAWTMVGSDQALRTLFDRTAAPEFVDALLKAEEVLAVSPASGGYVLELTGFSEVDEEFRLSQQVPSWKASLNYANGIDKERDAPIRVTALVKKGQVDWSEATLDTGHRKVSKRQMHLARR